MNKKDKKSKLRELIGREIMIAENSDNFSGRVVFGFIDKDNYFSVCSPKEFNLQNDDTEISIKSLPKGSGQLLCNCPEISVSETPNKTQRVSDGMRHPGYYVINTDGQEGLAYKIKIREINNIESTNGTNTVVLGNNKEIK